MIGLLIGIFIGFGIGMAVGIYFAVQQNQMEATLSPTPEATLSPTPKPTSSPTPEATLSPTPEATSTPTPTPTKTAESSTEDFYGALHVDGTHLVTKEGTPVQLRGISTHGLGWFPEFVNASLIAQVRQEWGCNVFRLAMYTAEYNGYCTSDCKQKENLKNIIDSGVQAAIEQNMYVIIDWHILSDNNPNTHKEEAKNFFAEMAEKYADVPNVLYEICNEPNGGTSWSDIRQYALEIIPVIRSFAPEAVIVVGTPTWSQDVDAAAQNPITEYDNIMYALHFYAATHTDGLRNKCKTAVGEGLPLFVTEYGICDASGGGSINETEANKWIELLDGYGISHVMWNLSNKSETCAVLKNSCSKTSNLQTEDLSPTGKWFVRMMQDAGLGSTGFTIPEESGNSGNDGNSADGTSENGNAGQTELTAASLEIADIFETADNIELSISNSWISEKGHGVQLNVVIKNDGASEETNWVRTLKIKQGCQVEVSQYWCARITTEGSLITIRPEDYNKTVSAGGEVAGIGIIVEVR